MDLTSVVSCITGPEGTDVVLKLQKAPAAIPENAPVHDIMEA